MNIVKISIYLYKKPFRFKYDSTQIFRTGAESVIVRLEFDNGISGYGEGIPIRYITGEDSSSVVQVIQHCFSPLLFSHDISTFDHIESLLGKLERASLAKGIFHYNAALAAIDIALLDALGKYRTVPLVAFLGPFAREKASYSISVPLLPLRKIQELFSQLPQAKITNIKVLVGNDEKENIERVRLVRSLCGDTVDIRVENNGIWTLEEAASNLEKLKKFHITAAEQPLVKDNIEGLQSLRKAIGLPIVVDESMCSLTDAKQLIEKEACDILNIKISKCGGLLRSKRIAQFAHAHNVPCQMGAHVGETELLRSAGESFALTMPNMMLVEGASFLLFEETWENASFEITSKDALAGIGLGINSSDMQSIVNYCSLLAEFPI